MTRDDTREFIACRLEGAELERAYPCVVGSGDGPEPCERTSTMAVYGLPMCPEHGEEAAAGALEELHQDAEDFFSRFTGRYAPELPNPLVRAAMEGWASAVPEDLRYSDERTGELLLRAFPFREDGVVPETAGEIADPVPDQESPYDAWRHHRHEMHALMRHAHRLGLTFVVEGLECHRETCAAQAAYALALERGDHPEVLERAHRENLEDARKAAELFAEHFAQRPAQST